MTLTQIKPAGLSKPVDLADNEKIRLGTGNDLQIYHDGTNTVIDNFTGGLFIKGGTSNGITLQNRTGNESMARFIPDGAAELYYDNAKKLETTSTGIKISSGSSGLDDILVLDSTGNSQGHGGKIGFKRAGLLRAEIQAVKVETSHNETDIVFKTTKTGSLFEALRIVGDTKNVQIPNDTGKLQLGTSQDLQIYHDGSHSRIKHDGTGILSVLTDGWRVNNAANTESYIRADANGAVELYFDGSKKLNTNSGGVTVTGHAYFPDNNGTHFGANEDLKIYHNGTQSFILNTTGNLILSNMDPDTDNEIHLRARQNEQSIVCKNDGAVELYNNNNKRSETSSIGLDVFNTVRVLGDTAPQIQFNTDTSLGTGTRAMFGMASAANNFVNGSAANDMVLNLPEDFIISNGTTELIARFIKNGAVELYFDNSKKIETVNGGVNVTGDLQVDGSGTSVTIKPTDGLINFGMDGRSSFVTGENSCYIFSGSGSGGDMPAGDLILQSRSNTNRTIRFATGSTPTQRVAINHNGLHFGTGNPTASSSIDDYEEGSFTPTYGYSSSAQSGFSMSENHGHYIKIGRIVHLQWWTNFSATPTSGNALQLQLPFTSASNSGYRGGIPFSFSGITYVGNSTHSQGGRSHINYNVQWMELGFQSFVNGGTWTSSAITPTGMANNSNFQGEGTYLAAS